MYFKGVGGNIICAYLELRDVVGLSPFYYVYLIIEIVHDIGFLWHFDINGANHVTNLVGSCVEDFRNIFWLFRQLAPAIGCYFFNNRTEGVKTNRINTRVLLVK
jgi:hypothetical protein